MAFKATAGHNKGTSKKSAGRRRYGLGRSHSRRADRITKHNGVGVGYNVHFSGKHNGYRQHGNPCRKDDLGWDWLKIGRPGAGIHAKQPHDWANALAVEAQRRAEVWARRTICRAANRAAFTLEAVYQLLGYDVKTLTVVKQAVVKERPTFKSVGAAAYQPPQREQNKANNKATTMQETTMTTVDHSPIFNLVTASGGIPVCYMQMDKTQPCDGTIVAGLVYVNVSEHKVIRNLFPKDDFVKMEDALAFYKPDPTPGKSYTCSLGFIPDEAADATKLRMGQVTMHTIRVFGSVCREINGVPQVLVGDWTNAAYVTKKLTALDENNQHVPVGAADIHFVFNLPGRQPRKSEGLPPAEISTPRQYVRDLIYGNAIEESFFVDEFLYNHPNFSFTSGSNATTLNECVANHEGLYFNGADTGIHVALVIGHVAKTTSGHDDIEMWKVGGADNFGQARVYLDKMAVVYLPIKTVFKVFQPTADFGKFNLLNTGMWPLFQQVKHSGVTVDTRTLCEVVAKVGINNRWNTYNQYCGKSMSLEGISIGNAPYVAPQQEVPIVEAPAVKPEAPVAQASIELPPVSDDSIAKELAAYDAAQKAARVGLPVKDVDYKAFMRSRAYLTKVQDVKLEHFGNGYAHAALIVAALAGEMASVLPGGRVRCKGYHWEKRHLVTLIDALKYAHAAGLVEQVDGSTTSIRNYFEVKDLPNDEFELWMDGAPTFRFLSNRVVVDIERGRIFHHTLELAYPNKNEDNLQYYIADSFSNFMHYFVNGMMQLMGAYFDGALPANYRSNCMKFLSNMPSIKLSKDNWHEENGAARLMMENSYVPIIGCVTPFLASDGKHNALGAGAASLAKIHSRYEKLNKVKQEGKKDKVVSLNEMNTLAMRGIKGKYYLESHFTKASYLPFGAVHVDLLKSKCPTLLAHAEKFLGYDFTHNETAAVIIMTLKATKGLKRVTLAMAQAARPVKPAGAGFVLRNQNVRTVGTAVNVLLAPSLIYPPGQNPWVGSEEDMPAAYVSKTERNYMVNSFKLDENGSPFDFTYSDLPTFVDNEWVLEDRGDSYTYVVPQREAIIEGNKPLMFTVRTDDALAYEVNDVRHERDYNAKLDWIRFRVDQSVTRDDANLVIEYQATWIEHYGKIRSFNKAQIIRCNPILVRNRLNPSLEGIKFDMICTQDALKLDVLYSMLMLIGNSVNANYRNGNKSAKMTVMFNEIRRINKLLGWNTNEADPILVIDEVAVVSGLYKNLLDYFEANLVHPEGIWFDFRGDTVQARIVYEIYRNKATEGKDWEKVPNPLASKLGTYLVLEEGETVVAYKEVGELSHKTNILVFILDKDGMPTGYLQRTYVICGDVDAPLVNVELYESSTVQESVSTSNIDLPTIVAMEHCISDKALAIKVQKELLNGGRQSMLRFKALAYADQNISVIDGLTPIYIQQVGDTLAISDEDRAKLWAALNQGDITKEQIAIRGTHCFKQVCLKLANYEFVLPKSLAKAASHDDFGDYEDFGDYSPDFGEDCAPVTPSSPYYRIWMPVLYSFSGLTSRNENNQSFEAIFYKDILKMLLQGQKPMAILAQRCYYVMRSLLNSEDMLKLPMGKQNVTAKRVALGDIRVGEIHIVKSSNPKSPYQKARRQGMEAGSIIHGSRKPLAIGYLAKLAIRQNVEYRDAEGNLICVKQFILRPGEKPVEARYFLSDVQIGCDVFIPTAYDRGDFDGDGFYITLIDSEGVVANTWDDGVAILHAASQLHPFAAENGSYFCDHYGIKTYAQAMKTMGSGIVAAITDKKKGVILDLDVHAANNANAIKVQHGAVGVAYAVYQIGMIMTNLMSYVGSHFADAKYYSDALLRVFMRDNIKHLVGLAAEMYEVMLGGFDKGPDAYRDILDSIVKGERFYSVHMPNPNGDESITKYNEKIDANHKMVEYVMDLLGTKVDAHKEVAVIIELTSIYYQIKKGYNIELQQGKNNTCTIKADSARNWVALATFIFEIGRSEFTGFRGVGRPNLANYYSDDKTSEEIKAEAFQKCADLSFAFAKAFAQRSDNIYIYALVDIEKTLGSVISCTPEQIQTVRWDHSDCMTFINACKGEDVIETVAIEVVTVEDSDDLDDSDDDGGSVVANDDKPNQPNDDNGGECAESQAKYEDTEILMEVSKGEYYVDSEVKELAYALDFKVKFSLRDLNQFNGFLRQKGLSPIHRVENVNGHFLTNILDHDISLEYMESSNGLKTSYDQLVKQVNQLKEDNLPIFLSYDTRCWAMMFYLLREDCGFNRELDCRYYWKPSKENQTTDNEGEAIIEQTEMIEETETAPAKRGEVKLVKHITRQMLKDNPNAWFVFGDNFERRGMGGQAKEMRGEPNAIGIATKHKPSNSPDAFFTDADFYLAKAEFVEKFGFLNEQLNAGKDVYFPEDGIGTGLSALANHSVRTWNYLTLCLRTNLGITKFLPVSEKPADVVEASAEPSGADVGLTPTNTMKVLNMHQISKADSVFGNYIGRAGKGKVGSPLANPFHIGKDGTREECCEKYTRWLWDKVQANDLVVLNELTRLHKEQKDLICFCAPKQCHGDVIIKCLKWMESVKHAALFAESVKPAEQDIVEDDYEDYCPDFDDDFSDSDNFSPVEFEETDWNDLIEITSSDAAQAAQSKPSQIDIYTDGACKGNPGRGGWGVAIYVDSVETCYLSGHKCSTTNNVMEMTAMKEALSYVKSNSINAATIYADSQYVINCMTGKWKIKANAELWSEILELYAAVKSNVEIKWVKGHASSVGNNRADELASNAAAPCPKCSKENNYKQEAPMPSDTELAQIAEFLRQQLSVHGEDLKVKELLINLNDKQQNKANKLDDIVAGSVPEMKEIVIKKPRIQRMDLQIHSKSAGQYIAYYKAIDPSTGEIYELSAWDGHDGNRDFYCICESNKFMFAVDAGLYDKVDQSKLEGYTLYAGKANFVYDRNPNAPTDYTGYLAAAKKADLTVYHNANGSIEKYCIASESYDGVVDNQNFESVWFEDPELFFIAKGFEHTPHVKTCYDASIYDETTVEDNFPTYIGEVKHIYPEIKEIVYAAVDTIETVESVPAPVVESQPEPVVEPEPIKPAYYTGVGSRKTPADIQEIMMAMAEVMGERGFILRSGHAEGADKAFEAGAIAGGYKLNSYLPFNGFNGGTDSSHGCDPNGIAYADATTLPNYAQAQQILKETIGESHFNNLKGFALKAHTRNVYQVLGDDLNTPSVSLYCWTPSGAEVGGTATAIKLAKRYNVPVINLGNPEHLANVKTTLALLGNKEVAPVKSEDKSYGAATLDTVETVAAPTVGNEVKSEANTQETPPPATQARIPIQSIEIAAVKKLIASLTEEQYNVVKTVVNQCANTFLTGKGGAGKSFTVDIIRKCYDILGYPYLIVGSTGTSVVNIDGHNTFNGMFGLGRGFDSLKCNKGKVKEKNQKVVTRTLVEWEELRKNCRGSKQLMNRLPELKAKMERHQRPLLIIVDEISQCDSLLLSAVEDGLNARSINHHWLLVGDPMQFEPVNGYLFFKDVEVIGKDGSKVLKQSPYNIKELNFIGFNLKDNMRAKGDKEWSDALDKIRMHQIVDDVPEVVKQRWEYSEVNAAPAEALVIAPTNKTVNRFNKIATDKLLKAGARNKSYTGTVATKVVVAGKPADHWLWKNAQYRITIFDPIKYEITLCEGMRVMLRSTNMKTKSGDMKVNNGQTGTIRYLGDNYVKVAFDNGVIEDVKPIEMEDPSGYGTFTQIPLVPAYAITINKSQGMTFDIPVVFHMYNENPNGTVIPVIGENAFYVALSRLTTSKNCWFETGMKGIDPKFKQELTPYNVMIKSYKTNIEARNFTLDLK